MTWIRSIFASALLCAFGAASAASQQAVTLDTAAITASLLAEMRDRNAPGAAIAIVLRDSVVYQRGFGVESVEYETPIAPTTLFRIGSVTKPVTSLVALTLAREGVLDLHAPVGTWLTGIDSAIAGLTLHNLLQHRAGLAALPAGNGSHDDSALVARVRSWDRSLVFAEQSEVYSYSSPDYWLAGAAAEGATGEFYADLVRTHVLAPLGMPGSTLRPLEAFTHPTAQDHRYTPGGPQVIRPYPDDASTWPGGSLFSSAHELTRLARALLNRGRLDGEQVLDADVVEQLMTRQNDGLDPECGFTYGLSHCTAHGGTTLGHYGFRSGSGAVFTLVPEKQLAVVILTNIAFGIFGATENVVLAQAGVQRDGGPSPAARAFTAEERARAIGVYVAGRDTLTFAAVGAAVHYRYGGRSMEVAVDDNDGALLITDDAGQPVQRFELWRSPATGRIFLHDGLNAFRKLEAPGTGP